MDARAPEYDASTEDAARDAGSLTCEHAEVLFVIDGSGSMCAEFGASTRWQAVRAALLDPASGVVPVQQANVAFGVMAFEGTIDPLLGLTGPTDVPPGPECAAMYTEQKMTGECPGLVEVPVALNNAAAIDGALPATELGGSTPTDKAMNAAVDRMLERAAAQPARERHIVLITDGRPNDICTGGLGGDGTAQHQALVAAVDRGSQAGITTFVINLWFEDLVLGMRLDEVAQHGQQDDLAAAFTASEETGLSDALTAVMSRVGCGM